MSYLDLKLLDPLIFTLYILLGITASSLGMLAGLAGGIILVPLLIVIGVPVQEVIGTVQSALILPTLIASIEGFRRKEIFIRFAIIFEFSTIAGTWIGAYLTIIVPSLILKLVFTGLAFFFSVMIFRNSKSSSSIPDLEPAIEDIPGESKLFSYINKLNKKVKPFLKFKIGKTTEAQVSIPLMVVFGLFIGITAGMLGIGGGWIKTPLMIIVYKFPVHSATSTALFMALITVTSGGLAHAFFGNLNLELLIPLAIGLTLGSFIGLKIKHRLASAKLSKVVAIILAIVALLLLLSTIA